MDFVTLETKICSYKERRDEVKKMREGPSENELFNQEVQQKLDEVFMLLSLKA